MAPPGEVVVLVIDDLRDTDLLFLTVAIPVSCVDKTRKTNPVTIGWAMKISPNPPMVAISVKSTRYSHGLHMETNEFISTMPDLNILKTLHFCGWTSDWERK